MRTQRADSTLGRPIAFLRERLVKSQPDFAGQHLPLLHDLAGRRTRVVCLRRYPGLLWQPRGAGNALPFGS